MLIIMIDLKTLNTIAVTGATGFIADALIKELVNLGVHVHAIARNEGDLVNLKGKYPSISIFPCPVEDEYLMKKACFGCDGIFHLAAVKGVPVAEQHPLKTVQTNINGTINILKLSVDSKMRFVVGASSDKAEKMSGVYGASKYLMEKLFEEFESFNGEKCMYRTVRFGNVFYSTGSVLDVWKKSLKTGTELEISNPESTRFFWTKEEAANELLRCLSDEALTEPHIPKLKSVRIGTLMEEMISLYGNDSTKWRETGLRESENLHEFLSPDVSSEFATQWDKEELRSILKNYEE
jgi:UDP-N-acetylglucosamine 4,6-dehydratase